MKFINNLFKKKKNISEITDEINKIVDSTLSDLGIDYNSNIISKTLNKKDIKNVDIQIKSSSKAIGYYQIKNDKASMLFIIEVYQEKNEITINKYILD